MSMSFGLESAIAGFKSEQKRWENQELQANIEGWENRKEIIEKETSPALFASVKQALFELQEAKAKEEPEASFKENRVYHSLRSIEIPEEAKTTHRIFSMIMKDSYPTIEATGSGYEQLAAGSVFSKRSIIPRVTHYLRCAQYCYKKEGEIHTKRVERIERIIQLLDEASSIFATHEHRASLRDRFFALCVEQNIKLTIENPQFEEIINNLLKIISKPDEEMQELVDSLK